MGLINNGGLVSGESKAMNEDTDVLGWVPAGLANTIQHEAVKRSMIKQNDLVLWRGADGLAHAWENRCPHRGMRLSYGVVRENRLTCLYHGWTFNGDGHCDTIPAHPDLDPPATICTKMYRCVESGGLLWVAHENESSDPPMVRGNWAPCRSLHFSREVALPDLISGIDVDTLNAHAQYLNPPDKVKMLLAMQPMGKHGMMLHLTLPVDATPEDHHHASRWFIAHRLTTEIAA